MDLWAPFVFAGFVIAVLMTLLWLLSLKLRDASIVDIFWGTGFVIAAWIYFSLTPQGILARKLLICGLVTIWGLRLSIHLFRRNWGRGEDYRYANWRKLAGNTWLFRSLINVFLLQGGLIWLISAPLLAAQSSPTPRQLTWVDGVGAGVWAVGFFFESLGDWQLARFKADPRNWGKVLDRGLWRYTRHPNYFGDALQWWGFFLVALASGGWWTIFSPALMTFLLVRVSGVAMLERSLVEKPGYQEYVRRTSAFFPLPPRREED